ncbi:tail fiber assembly protein, partial [Salmonella sp. 741265064_HSA]
APPPEPPLILLKMQEKTQLDEWKKYRVLVNRVDTLNPDWPEKPSQL